MRVETRNTRFASSSSKHACSKEVEVAGFGGGGVNEINHTPIVSLLSKEHPNITPSEFGYCKSKHKFYSYGIINIHAL
jgi:hypothetical protein